MELALLGLKGELLMAIKRLISDKKRNKIKNKSQNLRTALEKVKQAIPSLTDNEIKSLFSKNEL